MKKKILMIFAILAIVLVVSVAGLYFFKKDWIYAIYDSMIYAKESMQIQLSGEYKKENYDASKVYYKKEKNIRIPILIYHKIVETNPARNLAYLEITPQNFEKQIKGLLDYGYQVISYEDLIAYYNGQKALPERVVLITFDDGYESVYQYAFPIAEKYQIPMTTFVVDDIMQTQDYLTWEEAKQMYDSGWFYIYSHGKTHIYYDQETPEELVGQITEAMNHIEQELGKTQEKVFTYPYGAYTDEHRKTMWEAGFIQNLTNDKINDADTLDLSGLSRIYILNHDSIYSVLKKIK